MEGEERRAKIVEMLTDSNGPVSGSKLAGELNVSRQIIVGDVALIRAQGTEILATNSGYMLADFGSKTKTARINVKHKLEDSYDELCTILDEGAKILNEGVVHEVYGEIVVPLNIASRSDAKHHTEKLLSVNSEDLMILTNNVHFHTIEADNDLTVLRVQRALREKGYLIK